MYVTYLHYILKFFIFALLDEELEGSSIEEDADKSQEEIYSCNTCGVSFSSVLEHIQNYHNNQDVVVEVWTLKLWNLKYRYKLCKL